MHDPYYDTARHKRWRERVLRKDKYLCQECARYGKRTTATHAHHVKPRAERPDLACVVSNGRALCTSCHDKIEPRARRK